MRYGCCFFFSSRRRHTRWNCDWSSDVCSSDLAIDGAAGLANLAAGPTAVGEDASTLAAQLAGDGAQSRPASRSCPAECRGAECAPGVTSATLQQSETDGSAALVRTVTETNPGT